MNIRDSDFVEACERAIGNAGKDAISWKAWLQHFGALAMYFALTWAVLAVFAEHIGSDEMLKAGACGVALWMVGSAKKWFS